MGTWLHDRPGQAIAFILLWIALLLFFLCIRYCKRLRIHDAPPREGLSHKVFVGRPSSKPVLHSVYIDMPTTALQLQEVCVRDDYVEMISC